MASNEFLDAIKARRTFYAISKNSSIPDSRILEIVKHGLNHIPSSFNNQTNRALVLLGQDSDKLWDIVLATLKTMVPEVNFPATETRIAGFKAGYGTILFFEDVDAIKDLEVKFATYKDRFAPWSQQSSGMFQFATWVALEKEGLGASLQHYNPLIDDEVRTTWDVPSTWRLIAQMPFGVPTFEPKEKDFQPVETKFKIFGGTLESLGR